MKPQEYTDLREALTKDHEAKLYQLAMDYINSNSKYGIGDVIKNGENIIRVLSKSAYTGSFLPEVVYCGERLNTRLDPMTKGDKYREITGDRGTKLIRKNKDNG